MSHHPFVTPQPRSAPTQRLYELTKTLGAPSHLNWLICIHAFFFLLTVANTQRCTTGGTLDGSGQTWYDLYAEDKYTLRPVL